MIINPGLAPGAQIIDFELPDFNRKPWSFKEARRRGPVLLVLFRGGWCPFCSTYLRRVQAEIVEKARALGAEVAAISSDAPGIPSEHADKSALGFPILSDPEGKVLAQFNAANQLTPEEYEEEKKWHDVEAYSMNRKHIIAVPGVIVVNRLGRVVYCELNLDLNKRPDPALVLKMLADA